MKRSSLSYMYVYCVLDQSLCMYGKEWVMCVGVWRGAGSSETLSRSPKGVGFFFRLVVTYVVDVDVVGFDDFPNAREERIAIPSILAWCWLVDCEGDFSFGVYSAPSFSFREHVSIRVGNGLCRCVTYRCVCVCVCVCVGHVAC